MQYAVPAEVGHVAVDIRQGYAGDKVQIYVLDVDFIQISVCKTWIANLLHVTEEIPKVQKIFVHRPSGMCLDSLMVR